ncbi:dNA polymerase III epsilon subunit [Firmicutes bacterium CAG:631]|nr:dNA polymerase III epsilon subunit [Firmicutes bacterium CAG:631]
MRYLFFDIECCNGRNICEFGYVITDDKFNILEKKDITINPENKFNLTGRPDGRDLYLYYPESTYYRSNKFPYFYENIKKLIEYPDQLIVGHAISNDAGFLRSACRRYKLDPINFKFADSQRMFSEFANIRKSISLETAGENMNVEKPKYLHKSDDDSELTMNLVKGMCKQLDCSLEELIELCDSCFGKSENNQITYDDFEIRQQKRYEAAKSGVNNTVKGRNYRMFLQFLDGVKPQGDIVESDLNDKSLCVSLNYEIGHFKEMLSLVQLLTNHNATYKMRASDNDIFVTCDAKDDEGNIRHCSRLKHVNDVIAEGKNIKIISFDELLKILNVTEEELSTMPFPDASSFYKKAKPRQRAKKKEPKFEKKEFKGPTLGDLFPDLFKKLKNEIDEDK